MCTSVLPWDEHTPGKGRYVYQLFVIVTKYAESQLNGRKIYSGSQFQSFQSMVSWFHCSAPDVRLNIIGEGCKTAHLVAVGKLKWKPGKEEGARDKIYLPLKGMLWNCKTYHKSLAQALTRYWASIVLAPWFQSPYLPAHTTPLLNNPFCC